MSTMRSSICVASGRPAPRYAAVGVVLVTALQAEISTLGISYTPWPIIRVRNGRNAPTAGYAPASATIRARRPTMRPSRFTPSSAYCTWARPCTIATMFSERDSVHLTGRSRRRASDAAITYSQYAPCLAPKPPPTAGATTRTSAGSRPSAPAGVTHTERILGGRGSWCTSNNARCGASTLGGGGSRTRVFRDVSGASPSASGKRSRVTTAHRRRTATPASVRCPTGS